ncbi:Fe(3+) ions import ATP-binding protein FbpC [Thiorhodovibrio litoralis]|nr:ABC transporter ATP-binding protein [Thiorhodovibrio litoralis]WPL11246.1 Fe(3+) ions import ATP-binding protein FbpC [Thiorhodovibrio litoralis]
MTKTSRLLVRGVSIGYGGTPVVRDASLELMDGSIGCLLGPSGCGKTTLLRAVAGFEPVMAGEIRLGGELVSRPGVMRPAEMRQIGMMFQDFALFPHLTVAKNVAFGLHRLERRAREQRVAELLELVGLTEAARRHPHELSGGMQQRVALARALAPRPQMLLLDEPFSSMDVELREALAREIRALLRHEGVTAILVTHDQLEAFAMADQIAVMREGRIHQTGTGFELYHQPADRFVADFIGQGEFLPGRVLDGNSVVTELGELRGRNAISLPAGTEVDVLVRPDDLVCTQCEPQNALQNAPQSAQVTERAFRGAEYLYTLKLDSGRRLLCLAPSHDDFPPGSHVGLHAELDHLVVFERGAVL